MEFEEILAAEIDKAICGEIDKIVWKNGLKKLEFKYYQEEFREGSTAYSYDIEFEKL